MSRPRLLDLFCGAGGAAVGYHRAGFDVVGVDCSRQPNYPFEFWQLDVFAFMGTRWPDPSVWRFDVIHASPPCQFATAYRRRTGVAEDAPNLISATRDRLLAARLPYVIENVEQSKSWMRSPVMLCGSSFGLDVRRHRLFESNRPLLSLPCQHAAQTPRFPPATNRKNLRKTVEVGAWRCADIAPAAMGIDWMTNDELSQAIPPAYTQFLGEQLMQFVQHHSTASEGPTRSVGST